MSWDSLLNDLGGKVVAAAGTYLEGSADLATDPAKQQYKTMQTATGPQTVRQTGGALNPGMPPLAWAGVAVGVAALALGVYLVVRR